MFIPEYSFLSSALNIIQSPKKKQKVQFRQFIIPILDSFKFDKSYNQGHSDEGVLL